MKKKIIYIVLLVVVLVGIVLFFAIQDKINIGGKQNNNSQVVGNRSSNEVASGTAKTDASNAKKATIRKELEDGVLYTFSEEDKDADIVIGDNFFDTQITDIMNNFALYKGKTIEIEGMFLDSAPYTFVGRYSTSNMCAYCPQGFSYFEYVWDGDKFTTVNEQTWLKVKGTLCVGNDNTSNFQDYYYIQASSIEVKNEKGIDTVNN